MASLDDLFKTIAESYGIEKPQADESGAYSLLCDSVELTLIPAGEADAVLMFAPVARQPETGAGTLAQVLLQVNHLFKGGEGASFSLDPETHQYCLQRILDLSSADTDSFAEALSSFIALAEHWQSVISQYSPDEKTPDENTPTAEHSDGDSGSMHWMAV